MREIGASPETTGFAIGMDGISELPFYFIAAWLLQRLVPGKVVLIAIFATALRLFFYSVNNNPNLVILIESMNGLTWTLLWVSAVEFVNNIVPAKWRTTGQSLLWAAYYGAGAVTGNIASGWLLSTYTNETGLCNEQPNDIFCGNCSILYFLFYQKKLNLKQLEK